MAKMQMEGLNQTIAEGFEKLNARMTQMEATLTSLMRWTEDLDSRLAKVRTQMSLRARAYAMAGAGYGRARVTGGRPVLMRLCLRACLLVRSERVRRPA